MLTTRPDQFTTTREGTLVSEASTLGLRPGEWPDFVAVLEPTARGAVGNLYNAPVREYYGTGTDRELLGLRYSGPAGSLLILND